MYRAAQIPFNAVLAEDKVAFGATENHAALAAPPAVQFAAILALLELAAVVKLVAGLAHGDFEDIVQADFGNGGQG